MRLVSAYYDDSGPFMDSGLFDSYGGCVTYSKEVVAGDCLVVWGGADISTSLYNHINHGYTHADSRPSHRDAIEWRLMKKAVNIGVPIIGVCRGAQMLCALAGSFLIQDVDNHSGYHEVVTPEGRSFQVNSIHHQMMFPWGVDHEMLAWTKPRSDVHWITNKKGKAENIQVEVEPEYVYYPGVKGFAIQWHPEMMGTKTEATQYIFQTMKERL